ncbi:MAG: DUF3419 family protein [Desulfovibrionaceae bacterium]
MYASHILQTDPLTHALRTLAGGMDRLLGPWSARLAVDKTFEDAAVDLAALRLLPQSRVAVAGQAADNAFACLTTDPAAVFVAAPGESQLRLTQLRLAALRALPDHRAFFGFVAEPHRADAPQQYTDQVRAQLDADARRWWEGAPLAAALFAPRIQALAARPCAATRQSRMAGLIQFFAPFAGCVPARVLEAKTMDGQRQAFRKNVAPLFDSLRGRRILGAAMRLYMHPAQRALLRKANDNGLFATLRRRTEHLVCGTPVAENPYVWQALAGAYSPGAAPLFLTGRAHGAMRANAGRLSVRHASLTAFLATQPAESMDGFLLSDSMDRMTPGEMTMLWAHIARTARPGARVVSRTMGTLNLPEAIVPRVVLDAFASDRAASAELLAMDRSGVWGGLGLHIKR